MNERLNPQRFISGNEQVEPSKLIRDFLGGSHVLRRGDY
jgi:hypothetical protein